jgi:DNA polymerase-3 subunit epsilon
MPHKFKPRGEAETLLRRRTIAEPLPHEPLPPPAAAPGEFQQEAGDGDPPSAASLAADPPSDEHVVPVEQLASLTLASHAGVHDDAPAAAAAAAAPAPAHVHAADVSSPPPRISNTKGVVVAMDVETTGLREDSEIIQIALASYTKGVLRGTFTRRFCPKGKISDGARAVHGISKEMLVDEDRFADWAKTIRKRLQRADGLLGYNIGFDLKMLDRELARAGVEKLDVTGKTLYDAYKLWTKLETRKLSDAVWRFVNGAEMLGAHDAGADIATTLHVHNGLVAEFTTQLSSPESITALSRGDCIDVDGKFSWPAPRKCIGSIVFAFGKHMGSPLFPLRTACKSKKPGWERASPPTSAARLTSWTAISNGCCAQTLRLRRVGTCRAPVGCWLLCRRSCSLARLTSSSNLESKRCWRGTTFGASALMRRLRVCGCLSPSRRPRCALSTDLSDCRLDTATTHSVLSALPSLTYPLYTRRTA